MSQPKTIKFFLASSAELKTDREQFEILINRENKLWIKKGVFFHLEIWEDFLDTMSETRLQDEYNKALRDCDFFVLLYHTKMGKYTEEEFDAAYKHFKEHGKPLLYIYFKTEAISTDRITEEILSMIEFRKKIAGLGHFQKPYKTTEELLLHFKQQLDKLVDQNRIEVPEQKSVASSKSKSLTRELTALPRINPDDIVGRETELEELHKLLFNQNRVVLVNGIGGVGKTTMAQAYMSRYYSEYKRLVWLTQTGDDAKQAFLDNRDLAQNLGLSPDQISADERLRTILNLLRGMNDGPNLLVIDNTDDSLVAFHDYLPGAPVWHVMATAREKIESFKELSLGFLSPDEALVLFKKHCSRLKDNAAIAALLKTIDYHTLTVEILAKTAQLQRASIDTLQTAIENNLKAHVPVPHNDDEEIDNVGSYLKAVFTISRLQLDPEEEWLMKQFCFLPSEFHRYDLLCELLQSEGLDWKDDFSEKLENLHRKGWLLKTDDAYKMHRIIMTVTLEQLVITFEDIQLLIDSVSEKLKLDQTKDNPVDKFPWVPFGAIILEQYERSSELQKEYHRTIFILHSRLASADQDIGNYKRAHDLLEKALEADIHHFGEQHPYVATTQSNLAIVYRDLGNYERARDLLEKALETQIHHFGEQHPNVSASQSNLAIVYKELGNYERARDLLENALETDTRYFGEQHPTAVSSQSNLAVIYQELGNYERACDLLEKALETRIRHFGEQHPNVAIDQSNLAVVYKDIGNYERARDLLEKALETDTRYFGEQHPNVAIRQHNLASVFVQLNEKAKAFSLFQKAYQTRKIIVGEAHPYTKNTKAWLDSLQQDPG